MNLATNKNLEFEAVKLKANHSGFELAHFSGYALIEMDSGADLYFTNLDDVNNYIDACDLSDHEFQKKYGFVTDNEI